MKETIITITMIAMLLVTGASKFSTRVNNNDEGREDNELLFYQIY